jgi:hypothetical protein
MRKGSTSKKPSRKTIRKRVATRRRNAAKRDRMRKARLRTAEGRELAAKARLAIDGACSTEATQRRILWLAHERKLPPVDIAKAMTCKLHHLADFIKRHDLSYDWLLYGDLKGLLRMPVKKQSPAILTAADIVKLYAELSLEDRRQITRRMAELLATAAADQS